MLHIPYTRARCGVTCTPGTFLLRSRAQALLRIDPSNSFLPHIRIQSPTRPHAAPSGGLHGGAARHGNPPLPSALSHGCYTLAIDPSAVLSVVCTCGAQHSSRSGSSISDIYGSRRLGVDGGWSRFRGGWLLHVRLCLVTCPYDVRMMSV